MRFSYDEQPYRERERERGLESGLNKIQAEKKIMIISMISYSNDGKMMRNAHTLPVSIMEMQHTTHANPKNKLINKLKVKIRFGILFRILCVHIYYYSNPEIDRLHIKSIINI